MGLLLVQLQLRLRLSTTSSFPKSVIGVRGEDKKGKIQKKREGPIMRTGFDSLVSGRGTSQGSRPREGQPGEGDKKRKRCRSGEPHDGQQSSLRKDV
ncbi:uncharacterized protein BO96DRAFT_112995 [Aspergillus niger CBS 101883]|uniref:Uncharacterized protein n=1 Tax=Aspergillus niger ATCC 13496 TaxID=1353008 RepID=A0A370C6A8_ASPNG|nr:uncharacterized protein BO96DRAFT_112995 [Aspergillus niger CBS 101883]PYH54311.1 hypothetical protein BO96DRAFT_112995 [Aspergillus niger CBS 101883]RDH22541.1 hypothetical protein M747DRAFT_179995 [Aspergillus niger ATCC 13496]